ncbi:hypothetical protein [Longitalea arenae]|uniref:hypothetical protein n=1 Tax=Longitalea arenae TaxID=2812558 RepID=UPI0019683628|nr:hypothetical protein [Longitalea arenae]
MKAAAHFAIKKARLFPASKAIQPDLFPDKIFLLQQSPAIMEDTDHRLAAANTTINKNMYPCG